MDNPRRTILKKKWISVLIPEDKVPDAKFDSTGCLGCILITENYQKCLGGYNPKTCGLSLLYKKINEISS